MTSRLLADVDPRAVAETEASDCSSDSLLKGGDYSNESLALPVIVNQ